MNCRSFWFTIWASVVIISLTHGDIQILRKNKIFDSETENMLSHAMNIFRYISKYSKDDFNYIQTVRIVTKQNLVIQKLQDIRPKDIVYEHSCHYETNLGGVHEMLTYFDELYEKFERYSMQADEKQLYPFLERIYQLYKSHVFDNYTNIGLIWRSTNMSLNNNVFQGYADKYNTMELNECADIQPLSGYLYKLYNKILLGFIKVYTIIMYTATHLYTEEYRLYQNKQNDEIVKIFYEKVTRNFKSSVENITAKALPAIQNAASYVVRRESLLQTDSNAKPVRYLCLRPVQSNYQSSFVIIGVRFVIINQVIHLQIKEGQFKDGKIVPGTEAWQKIQMTTPNHDGDAHFAEFNINNQIIDISEIRLPNFYAVTTMQIIKEHNVVSVGISGFPIINKNLCKQDETRVSLQSNVAREIDYVLRIVPTYLVNMALQGYASNDDIIDIYKVENLKNSLEDIFPVVFEDEHLSILEFQNVITNPSSPITGFGFQIAASWDSKKYIIPKLIATNPVIKISPEVIHEILQR